MTARVGVGVGNPAQDILVICDLDGTLVDSYSGIKAALQEALSAVRRSAKEPLGRWIVGPPLDELLVRACGEADRPTLAKAREAFVQVYDHDACKLAEPFPGVDGMLRDLVGAGARLALATNKRLKPTAAILEKRGWQSIFTAVETVDSRPGHRRKKSEMLGVIVRCHAVLSSRTYYVGDTDADMRAAKEVCIPFIFAAWGAVELAAASGPFVASTPDAVVQYVNDAVPIHPMTGQKIRST